MVSPAGGNSGDLGVLYYDPNPTTAKLANAGLRLAGYRVFNVETAKDAVDVCTKRGPAGDRTIVALLLDASADPTASANVLRALVKIPGAAELPGILLVSRNNPRPIPGAEGLPTLTRPFSTPGLIKIVRETLDDRRPIGRLLGDNEAETTVLAGRVKTLLEDAFPELQPDLAAVQRFTAALGQSTDPPVAGASLQGDLAATRLEAVLEMLATAGATGILSVRQGEANGRLHLDQGRIRLAEVRGTQEDLKFGRFVVEGGFMRHEELEAFAVGKDPEGRPLGQRLVEGGTLNPTDLAQVLVAQAREVTCHLLGWGDGSFAFIPSAELHPLAAMAAKQGKELLVAEALLDGLRRLDERAAMGAHMAGVDDVYMRVDEQVQRMGRHALSRDELAVLELLNGRNSVRDIARKTRTGTFAVAKVLYRLSKAHLSRRGMMPVTV